MNDQILEQALAELSLKAPLELAHQIYRTTGTGIFVTVVPGPIGQVAVVYTGTGVLGAAPADRIDDWLERNAIASPTPNPDLPDNLAERVRNALDTGQLNDLPVDLSRLTEFQRSVLTVTATIPVGQIRPYGWIAREIGKPGATRAVGSALNKNPIPILIPCHRVSKSDGHIGDYAYGPEMKQALLAHEGLDIAAIERLADRGIRFIGSAETRVVCHPSCSEAVQIPQTQTVEFRTQRDADKAGYEPCRACRPLAA